MSSISLPISALVALLCFVKQVEFAIRANLIQAPIFGNLFRMGWVTIPTHKPFYTGRFNLWIQPPQDIACADFTFCRTLPDALSYRSFIISHNFKNYLTKLVKCQALIRTRGTWTNRCQSIRQPLRGWSAALRYIRSRILSPRWWSLGHCRWDALSRCSFRFSYCSFSHSLDIVYQKKRRKSRTIFTLFHFFFVS